MIWDLICWTTSFLLGVFIGVKYSWKKAGEHVWGMIQDGKLRFNPKKGKET